MKVRRKIIGAVVAVSIAIGAIPLTELPTKASGEVSPSTTVNEIMAGVSGIKDEQKSNIYYGNYQQNIAEVQSGTGKPKGTQDVDWRYCEQAKKNEESGYYQINPIKWRVLKKDSENKNLFLLADSNLDVFWFDKNGNIKTWGKSSIRDWLNGNGAYAEGKEGATKGDQYDTYNNFIDIAFSEKEIGENIKKTSITENDVTTDDKIFLLSTEEVKKYGFNGNSDRESMNTAYVAGGGKTGYKYMQAADEAGRWWLRSPGYDK